MRRALYLFHSYLQFLVNKSVESIIINSIISVDLCRMKIWKKKIVASAIGKNKTKPKIFFEIKRMKKELTSNCVPYLTLVFEFVFVTSAVFLYFSKCTIKIRSKTIKWLETKINKMHIVIHISFVHFSIAVGKPENMNYNF